MVARFNLTQTVDDIRLFINRCGHVGARARFLFHCC